MRSYSAKLLPMLMAGALAALSACKRDDAATSEPTVAVTDDAATDEPSAPVPSEEPSGQASGATSGGIAADLDNGALAEQRDPERLLRFYTSAIRVGDWNAAAKAWTLDAQMTAGQLQQQFGGDAGPKIAIGRGDWASAVGSVFYEVPITVDFADGRASRRGTIVMRRANDVPGASRLQLVWRIERSALVAQ